MTRQGETTGFVLVPSIPTPDQIAAAWDLLDEEKKRIGVARLGPGVGAADIYRAMLAASPEQPSSEATGGGLGDHEITSTPVVARKKADHDTQPALAERSTRVDGDRDNCQMCLGANGGVLGNENRVLGVVMCDYCHAKLAPALAHPAESAVASDDSGKVETYDHMHEIAVSLGYARGVEDAAKVAEDDAAEVYPTDHASREHLAACVRIATAIRALSARKDAQ